jgi:CRP-like cAMP-binding protein
MPQPLPAERALELLPYFRALRPDERVRIAGRIQVVPLQAGQSFAIAAQAPALVLVLDGGVSCIRPGLKPTTLFAGDSFGEAEVVAGTCAPAQVTAAEPSTLAVLDKPLLDALLKEFPVIALPLVGVLAGELKWRNNLLREVVLARAQKLSEPQLAGLLRGRRERLQSHRQRAAWRGGHVLWHVLFAEPARRPAFWIFFGAAFALVSARTVVGYIIKNGLQKQLFALIGGGGDYHPIHVHHFNYGLVIVSLTGLLSLVPLVRGALRFLALLFGFGMGLIVDEFALLWNLNPDYYQPSSRIAAALVLFALAQVVYFRDLYGALGRRLRARFA